MQSTHAQTTPNTPRATTGTRPGSVTFVAIFSFLRGALMLLALISVLAPSWEAGFVAMFASFLMHFTWSGLSAVTSEIGTSTTGTTIFIWTLPIVAIISLILAVGLWMLKGWARIGAIALSALDVVLSVLALAIVGLLLG